jgi:hypothetical protein
VIIDSTISHAQQSASPPLTSSVKEKKPRSFFSFSLDPLTALPSSEAAPSTVPALLSQTTDLPPPPLSPEEEREIEQAFQEATRLQDFFSRLDRSGDKFISLEELRTVLPSEGPSPPPPSPLTCAPPSPPAVCFQRPSQSSNMRISTPMACSLSLNSQRA